MALGCFWRFFQNKNRTNAIDWVKPFKLNGIELTLGGKNDLELFKPTSKQLDYLSGLEYVSVHAPFSFTKYYPKPEETEQALLQLKEIYESSHAKAVVFHPPYIPSSRVLKKYGFNVLIENQLQKKHISHLTLANAMHEYNAGFCLDTAHAYSYEASETQLLYNRFKKNLKQIHFSARYRNRDHQPLTKASPAFLKSIQPLKQVTCPIIIEEDYATKNTKLIQKEIMFAKAFFA